MSRKKKRSTNNNTKVHCACCKHSSCSWNQENAPKPKKTPEHLAEEKRILSDLQIQERFVTRLVDNIKLMKLYNEETDLKLKQSLRLEQKILKDLEEFQLCFKTFQEKLFNIELSHILLLSLSSDVLESCPDLKELRKASGDAIKLCLVMNRRKRMFLVKQIKECGSHRRRNAKLSVDLQDTKMMQMEAEKQVAEMIQNIKTCKNRVTQDMGFEDFVQAYKNFEANSKKIAGILAGGQQGFL